MQKHKLLYKESQWLLVSVLSYQRSMLQIHPDIIQTGGPDLRQLSIVQTTWLLISREISDITLPLGTKLICVKDCSNCYLKRSSTPTDAWEVDDKFNRCCSLAAQHTFGWPWIPRKFFIEMSLKWVIYIDIFFSIGSLRPTRQNIWKKEMDSGYTCYSAKLPWTKM